MIASLSLAKLEDITKLRNLQLTLLYREGQGQELDLLAKIMSPLAEHGRETQVWWQGYGIGSDINI